MQSEQLKTQMVSIRVDKSLSNSALYKHRCLLNINKLYTPTGKCEYQCQYKAMIESEIVPTPKGCTDNSTMTPNSSVSNKNSSARKLLHQFTETLDVKHKTAVCRFAAAKAKRRQSEGNKKREFVVVKHCKVPWSYQNKSKGQRIPLPLNYTLFSGCTVYHCKLLSLLIYWWQLQNN